MHAYMFCQTCKEYGDRRMAVLAPHIVKEAVRRVIDPIAVLHDFMAGVHARHVQGLPLSTPTEEILDRLTKRFAALGISLPEGGEVRFVEGTAVEA